MKYCAHSNKGSEDSWQTMLEHLENTALKAEEYAAKFGAGDFGYMCGILHDLGKYSNEFQHKLRGKNLRVDHSTAGAKEAIKLYGKLIGKLLAYCIAGHHSGLHDFGSAALVEGTLNARLNNNEIKDYSAYKNELDKLIKIALPLLPLKPLGKKIGFTFSFFVRMLYSCLVDADFIDTEKVMSDEIKSRGNNSTTIELNSIFKLFLSSLKNKTGKINIKRKEILERCIYMANSNTGLYTLTVPTGGGKTYSSMAFALNHAKKNGLERIIYVIPFTSIIEQNAEVFKNALGEQNVLEHHSNYQFNKADSENIQEINEKMKLASENWDIPIVVTTNVQFFESLFSNKSSKCRKIHNMAKSVMIFDEAQMLPVQYLKPCLLAVSELVKNYGATAVLCTATQPSIKENKLLPPSINPIEIMENPKKLYIDFKKVNVSKIGEIDDDSLANQLSKLNQVLCIVNTRKHAKEIYSRLSGDCFHLSTLMCPVHRQEVLKEIRRRLNSENKLNCRVVSTQLIEAGVDVDFPTVYRSTAGIDSIVQSAGRCNREGRLEVGNVFVFKPVSEYAKVRGYLERTAKVAEMVFRNHEDPISLEAIDNYFKLLYDFEGDKALDRKEIIACFEERGDMLEFDFQKAAENFKLIEDNSYSIVIPYNKEAKKLIEDAEFSKYPLSFARKLQPYTISVYEYEYKALDKNAALRMVNNSFIVLQDFERNYDKSTGLILPKYTSGEAIFA